MKAYNDRLYKFFMHLLYDENRNFEHSFGNLTLNEVHLVSYVNPDEEVTVSELANRLNLTLSSTSIAVDNLIKKKFLLRKRCDSDRRKVMISLREAGLELYMCHSEFHKQRINKLSRGVNPEELDIFYKVLEKMESNMKPDDPLDAEGVRLLSSFDEGDRVEIVKVCGGIRKKSNLGELGIFEKNEIRIVRKQTHGPLIIEVKGSRISIGRMLSDSILGRAASNKKT